MMTQEENKMEANEDHSHQIQQEQDRDFKRAQVELSFRLDRLEDLGKLFVADVIEIRELMKMIGGES